MYSKETTIINKSGLHARAASEFTRHATQFESEITVKNLEDKREGNAKSIIAVMAMSLPKGTPIAIQADGDDEIEAVDNMIALVDDGFGEEE
ncbi:MAG: HPr family phosphocarrier protein [Eubacteriaceae bacterium]|nr:HPr family phosphocarrier protein [Eubacteriaceae bacterium]